jgi:hypothetical protein
VRYLLAAGDGVELVAQRGEVIARYGLGTTEQLRIQQGEFTTLEVAAVQGGVTTPLGSIPRCAAPFTQALCTSQLTLAPHTFAPGPVQIQISTDSFIDAAYMALDNVRIEY